MNTLRLPSLALLFILMLVLGGCGSYPHFAQRWHYRHDFRLPPQSTSSPRSVAGAKTQPAPAPVSTEVATAAPAEFVVALPPAQEGQKAEKALRHTPKPESTEALLQPASLEAGTETVLSLAETDRQRFAVQPDHLDKVMEDGRKTNGMAIAGFVCALVGLFVGGLILGTLGIIFSAIALSRDKSTYKNRGLAIAGLVIGLVAVVGALIVLGNRK